MGEWVSVSAGVVARLCLRELLFALSALVLLQQSFWWRYR